MFVCPSLLAPSDSICFPTGPHSVISHYNTVSKIPQLTLPTFCVIGFACCLPKIVAESQDVILSKSVLIHVRIKTQISNKLYMTLCELA